MAVVRAVVRGFTSAALTIVPAPIVPVLTGTVTCAAGSKKVTGTATAFVSELTQYTSENKGGVTSLKGCGPLFLIANDTEIQEIDYIVNDTLLYLKNSSTAGFSGVASRACNAYLEDAQITGSAKIIIVPGGSITTPTNNDVIDLAKNNQGVVNPFIVPTGVSVSSPNDFEYYKP